ncbi:MAG: endolytic transglycosylase MltG, partial [Acutalibacteraceae bacterium]
MGEDFKISKTENDDDFVIGKGFHLNDQEPKSSKHKRAKKGNPVIRSIIWIVCIVVVSVGLAAGIIYAGADYMGIGFGRGKDTIMEIEMGTPASEIAEQLKETGAVKIPLLFRLYAKLKGYDSQFKYGLYNFSTEAGYEDICQMLINEGAKAETVKVTIPEGTGINDYTKNVNGENVTVPGIATLLERNNVCTRADFLEALENVERKSKLLSQADNVRTYFTLEGYLFPDTYDFYSYDSKECAKLAVNKMIEQAEKKITDDMFKRAEELGYSMNEILTLASIIQMEAGKSISEMPMVSSVFHNRLKSDKFTTLGSSPTVYYGKSFRQDDGRYNTYNVTGLPPGPLCSPGLDAIKAALYPKASDYYYFVTDSSGNFYFHKTDAEQQVT